MFIDTTRNIYQYFYILANNTDQKHRLIEVERDLGRQYRLIPEISEFFAEYILVQRRNLNC